MNNSVKDTAFGESTETAVISPKQEDREQWSPEDRLWVAEASRFDAMLAPVNAELLRRLHFRDGLEVLDVGCGTGAFTNVIRNAVGATGSTTGVDVSPLMLASARKRSADIHWMQADAMTMSPGVEYHAITSRFGVMMFDDPVAAFTNMRRHLKPAGRLVVSTWRDAVLNEWTSLPIAVAEQHLGKLYAEPGQAFGLADPSVVMSTLDRAGFIDVEIEPFDFAAPLGADVADVIGFFKRTQAGAMLDMLPDDVRRPLLDDLTRELESRVSPRGVELAASAWIVSARRRRCAS